MIEKQITAFTKIYGKTEEEIKQKLFTEKEDGTFDISEDYDSILLSWDEERVKKFKEKETKANDNGYKRAQKEVLTDVEKLYREAGLLEDGENFEAVVSKYEALKTSTSKKPQTEDEIKKSPFFLAYEEKIKKEYLPKAEHEAKLKEFSDKLQEIENNKKYSKVDEKALELFNPDNYVLPSDSIKRNNQIKLFLKELKSQFDDVEINGDTIVLIQNGKRLEDKHGNLINFNSVVDSVAISLFEPKVQEPKGGGGNKNTDPKPQGGKKYNFTATTKNALFTERNKLVNEATTTEEKQIILKAAIEYEKTLTA